MNLILEQKISIFNLCVKKKKYGLRMKRLKALVIDIEN